MSDYDRGYCDGLSAFAHWKDGVQYVGTCGTTLHDALLGFVNHQAYRPPKDTAYAALLAACKALPLGKDFTDAADFVDSSEAFRRAMELARSAIARAEAPCP